VATTRLGQFGVGVEPYGTFDPKDPAPTSDPHNPGLITRLSQFGVGVAKYGTFQPKTEATVVVVPVSVGGGGSGKRYPVGNLDLKTWQRNRKKLEAKVEAVEKRIAKVQKAVSAAQDYARLDALKKQLAKLQQELLNLLGDLDIAKKEQEQAEMDEVMAVYIAYRKLH